MSRTAGHSHKRRGMTTPMWWHHETTIVPMRRKNKALLKQVKTDPEKADAAIWPLDKKPYDYFW